MASNSFGQVFTITTWGESHGPAIGVVIDGCPAGIAITPTLIQDALSRRAPGRRAHTSPRREPDTAELLSGVFEGYTTGTPISILIRNQDADSQHYEALKSVFRPGHANFTYLKKYGRFDHRGGGRASARETAMRVAAGAIAKQALQQQGIQVHAVLQQVADITLPQTTPLDAPVDAIFCPDADTSARMQAQLNAATAAGDSLGGAVAFHIAGLPIGLGDPVYAKLEAKLAHAMLSIPATKGFEIGEGFAACELSGSRHNDGFTSTDTGPQPSSNRAGGTLGGISTGQPVTGRVAFKPTSSIQHTQQTVSLDNTPTEFTLPPGARHDPCVAIRAVPVVEAMASLVIIDCLLLNRLAQW